MLEETKHRALIPLLPVRSVPRSIEFYAKLGFTVRNTHTPEAGVEPVWAELHAGGACLMIARSQEGISAAGQPVLFYLYTPQVAAFRAELLANGVQAGAVEYPFWAPGGEFRVEDPDGYVLMVTHVIPVVTSSQLGEFVRDGSSCDILPSDTGSSSWSG